MEFAPALVVTVALLVYPASLSHYGILLCAPILQMVVRSPQSRWIAALLLSFVGFEYAFAGLDKSASTFAAVAMVWVACIIGWRYGARPGAHSSGALSGLS